MVLSAVEITEAEFYEQVEQADLEPLDLGMLSVHKLGDVLLIEAANGRYAQVSVS